MASVRLAVLDDNLYVRTPKGVMPQSSGFHKFVEAVARSGAFSAVDYLAPVRHLRPGETPPSGAPIDETLLTLSPTRYFSGFGDYVLRSGYLATMNWRSIDRAIAEADLVWLRLPSSNALLALTAGRLHGTPHFAWIAGRVSDVVRAQRLPLIRAIVADVLARGYDAVSDLAATSGPAARLDGQLFASIVTDHQVATSASTIGDVREAAPWRIVWAGRMAAEKGLEQLVVLMQQLHERNVDVTLSLIGDGPARPEFERAASCLRDGSVQWHGYIADRSKYFALLREADLFVYPTRADAVPKVVVEALAAGLPVVAHDVGAIRELLGDGSRGRAVSTDRPQEFADTITELLGAGGQRRLMRRNAVDWAAAHTDDAQAHRLVQWLTTQFPNLAWGKT